MQEYMSKMQESIHSNQERISSTMNRDLTKAL